MATAAFPEEVSNDFLECTICCDTYKNPKILIPCLHTFCEHCLREWVQKNDGDTFPCPICRQPVPLPQDGVDGLKNNSHLASLVKAVTEHQKIRQGKDVLLCTSCDEGKPATSRCSECAEFLCASCESAHRLVRATKGHTLFTFEELKTGKYDKVFRARIAPPCSKHSGEILKLYCRTCEAPICSECALFEHRDSQHDLKRIEEVAAEKKETILALTPQCQARMQFYRETEEVQKRLKEQLQLNAEGARQNVHKTISLASAKSTCEFAETLAREGGDYEVVSFSQDMTTRLNDLTKPPADAVDFELANISIDYSVMASKLTGNVPKTAQYSLSKTTKTELCSLLKNAPQCGTGSGTGRPLRPSEPSMSGNVTKEREQDSRSILVSHIPEGVNRDKLEIHFMRVSNGGADIESVTMVTDTQAKITYADGAAVERVLERPQVLNGVEVKVQKWTPLAIMRKKLTANKPFGHFAKGVSQSQPTVSEDVPLSLNVPCMSGSLKRIVEDATRCQPHSVRAGGGGLLVVAQLQVDSNSWN
ncbi:hypothetical protein Bbelb_267470 [Branchiostoma belcheri]|nr:hypothetical protein Bbelb_267470 [Branchiostoma belcheri]